MQTIQKEEVHKNIIFLRKKVLLHQGMTVKDIIVETCLLALSASLVTEIVVFSLNILKGQDPEFRPVRFLGVLFASLAIHPIRLFLLKRKWAVQNLDTK